MTISFRCLKCPTTLQAPDTASGTAVRCPKCQTAMRVPMKVPPPQPPPLPRTPQAVTTGLPASASKPHPSPRSQRISAPAIGLIALAAAGVLLFVCGGVGLTGVLWLTRDKPTPPKEERAEGPTPPIQAEAPPEPADNPAPKPRPAEPEPRIPDPKEAAPAENDLPPLPPLPEDLPAAAVPLVIAQAPSLDKLLADARAIAAALGKNKEFEDGLATFLKTISAEGMKGVDLAKPLGCYARVSDNVDSWAVVLLLPIRGEPSFRRLLRDLGFQEQSGGGGLVPFKLPQHPILPAASPLAVQLPDRMFVRFAHDCAHICLAGDPNLLIGDKLLDAAPMFVRRDAFLSVTLRLDRLPRVWRETALARIKGLKNAVAPVGGPAARQNADKLADFLTGHSEDLIRQGRNVSFDLGLDADKESLVADLYLQGEKGSRLATSIASLADAPSAFGSWPLGDTALAVRINVRLPSELRSGLPALVEEATRQTLGEVKDPKERQKHERLLRTVGETFAAGELDGAVLVRGRGEGQPGAVLGGVKVPNGAALEQLIRAALNEPENKELRALFEMDAERFGNVKAHRINAQEQYTADLRRMFGDNPMYLAFRPDAVLWAGGADVKQTLPQALRARPKSSPLLLVAGDLRRLNQLVALQPGDAALAREAFDAKHPGRFRVELTGGSALRLHVGLDLAILRFLSTRLPRVQP